MVNMMNLDDLNVVVCRPALHMDKEDVMELCSHIWDGGDYIPKVWDDWMADQEGMLGVAEMGGRVAGVFKLTKFREQEWYLEGLRVHPDLQDRGNAAHIHDYVLETWRQMGSGIIRLTTGSYNVKVHRMCERTGFKRIAEFIPFRAACVTERTISFDSLIMDEAQHAMEFVTSSPTHAFSGGLINLGWVYADLQLKHIQEAIGGGHAWWWKKGRGFISIWEDPEEDEHEPGIQLLACPVGDLLELIRDYRKLMGELGYKSAGWVAPNLHEVLSCLEKAGFERSWDVSLYIFELKSQVS
jgi:GNAT superfamily N-acetyltransferase